MSRALALGLLLMVATTAMAEKEPPAFFIYGDSTVDAGNNNVLETMAKSNKAPYGRDFDTHQATGRFCNGRLSVDYLASYMNLPFPEASLSHRYSYDLIKGANFASAGAGMLDPSGADLGDHVAMMMQTHQAVQLRRDLDRSLGVAATRDIMSKSLHYISIGSNDFIHSYLLNVSGSGDVPPLEYGHILAESLVQQIEYLYHMVGARKIAVAGVGPLGCTPWFLNHLNSTNGECIARVNDIVTVYNHLLRDAIRKMNLPGLKITYCDIFAGLKPLIDEPKKYGFRLAQNACCGAGRYGGDTMCLHPVMACAKARPYIWWDAFHSTSEANELMAKSLWSGDNIKICDINICDVMK